MSVKTAGSRTRRWASGGALVAMALAMGGSNAYPLPADGYAGVIEYYGPGAVELFSAGADELEVVGWDVYYHRCQGAYPIDWGRKTDDWKVVMIPCPE